MSDVREKHRMFDERICPVCEKFIPEGDGLYWAGYRLLIHHGGECDRVAHELAKDFTKSKRGRWVGTREMWRRLKEWRVVRRENHT